MTLLAGLLYLLLGAAQHSGRENAREILKELVEINTTESAGDQTRAAQAVARRLRAAGFPASDVQVLEPVPRKGNLVARFRGTGAAKPVLLLAHLDVVEARREDWSLDPFILTEKDGYYYGRGTQDDKGDAALLVANLIRLKREGFRPNRDLLLALTADEETDIANGVDWLLANRRDLIDAEYCINIDAGGGQLRHGKPVHYSVQAAEKGYATYRLRATNPGGHSSLPVPRNAIYELAAALERVRAVEFPVLLNPVTRAYFTQASATETGRNATDMRAVAAAKPDLDAARRLSASPYFNALLHTTCVATEIKGGHAENALPQSAEAVVNCRLLPGDTLDHVTAVLRQAVAGAGVEVIPPKREVSNPASPWPPPFASAITSALHERWPGLPVIGEMETGGTDNKQLRRAGIPAYGVSSFFTDGDDVRAHGRDERIRVQALYDALDFNYRLLKAVATSR
jgi:acetylornithine deacetylase/succinyl-diaminopimelate desuccinylase-like protein